MYVTLSRENLNSGRYSSYLTSNYTTIAPIVYDVVVNDWNTIHKD